MGLFRRQVVRTCQDCGESWTLSRSMARKRGARPRGVIGAPLRQGELGLQQANEMVNRARAGIDQELDILRQYRTCPKCGSENYRDKAA